MNYTDTEIWMDIKGFEGEYQASSHGHIKSLDRIVKRNGGTDMLLKGYILKGVTKQRGDRRVVIKKKLYYVNRLIAETFIENPENKSDVNHIDGNPSNNHVSNLEWVNRRENMFHAWRNGKNKVNKASQEPQIDKSEIWLDIKGYEGKYQISNYGRVKTLAYVKMRCNGKPHPVREMIRKPFFKDYSTITLLGKTYLIHRLVAEAFLPNPEGKKEVNHIDGNSLNNHVSNLEWATNLENQKHASETGLKRSGGNHPRARKIDEYTTDGVFKSSWDSITDAAKKLFYDGFGKSVHANKHNLRSVLVGRSSYALGSIWKYAC